MHALRRACRSCTMARMYAGRSPIARTFAIGNALIGLLLSFGVLVFDLRSWIVQVGAVLMAALLFASSFGLLKATRWRLLVLRVGAYLELGAAACVLAALALWAAELSEASIDLQASGTLTTLLALALLLPYLLLYPMLQLLWAHRQQRYAESS